MNFSSFKSLAALSVAFLAAVGTGPLWATDISQTPLIVASPNAVKPNILFVLDDSGSMGFDFLPDHVNGDGSPDPKLCRSAGATGLSSGSFGYTCCQNGDSSNACWRGSPPFGSYRAHPPFLASAFNGLAYNPNTLYAPPVKSDGTYWPSQNSANTATFTTVKNDAYGIQASDTIDLTTQFPDTEWCTDGTFQDCLRNDNYVLPGTVNAKNYTTFHAVTATSSGKVATGAPDVATTANRDFGPHFYNIVPAEYCQLIDLRSCSASPGASYPYAAPVRWCNSDANARAIAPTANSCQAVRNGTFAYPRFPTKFFTAGTAGSGPVAEKQATASFTITGIGCKLAVTALTVNGKNLLQASTGAYTKTNSLAADLAGQIKNFSYSATVSGSVVTITAPAGVSAPYSVSLTQSPANCALVINPASPVFGGYVAAQPAQPGTPGTYPGSFQRVDITKAAAPFNRPAARIDCANVKANQGPGTCTYDEEMTNFANWWAYYHTRMQSMKSSASIAFDAVGSNRRVGYMSINNNTSADYLNFGDFASPSTQRDNWYAKLTKAKPNNSTPLRTALANAGRLYGGRLNGTSFNGSKVVDPMQYSCQRNFTILSTDGFWNESNNPKQLDGSTYVGDQDSKLPTPMKDGNATANTLADVAAYYRYTDSRVGVTGSAACKSGDTGADVCGNSNDPNQPDLSQFMVTYTLGLGASGYMQFVPDYLTRGDGDFKSIKDGATPSGGICTWQASGACTWPTPVSNTLTAVDDLWHAAINGGGTYFSAANPADIKTALTKALEGIDASTGAAAAATTSNPNVTASDNSVFVSNFMSGYWYGDLKAQSINVDTGEINAAVSWSARELLDANNGRQIFGFSSGAANKLRAMVWGNLTAPEQGYFSIGASQPLSQFCVAGAFCLSAADQTTASGQKVFEFVMGDRSNEGALESPEKYFRQRTSVLGDIVNSEAVYEAAPAMNYVDSGYDAYKAAAATRQTMVYVGANDGMLHAFNATTGAEAWAYVPTAVIPNLYKLADKLYASKHQYFVDATPAISDVLINGQWRTVLIGGLGAGGRSYYALDVTDPAAPKALWEFSNANLGLTYGKPEIGKLKDGTWAVFLPSGYNNDVGGGDGKGRLFVLNVGDGSLIRSIATSAGASGAASGLAHIAAWVDKGDLDNTVLRVYGGDNMGNLWRFDVNGNVGAPGYDAQHLVTLKSSIGDPQPITSRPELGQAGAAVMVFVGTGRYLHEKDLKDTSSQSIYAVRDRLTDEDWGDVRNVANSFVKQTLTLGVCPDKSTACAEGAAVRLTANPQPVNLATDGGWFVDLPVSSERVTTDPQLALGTLVVNSNVITEGDVCKVGGSSWANFLDYRTGAPVSTAKGVASVPLGNAVATRPSIVRLPSGKVVSITRLSDASTKSLNTPLDSPVSPTRVVSWRDLIQQ